MNPTPNYPEVVSNTVLKALGNNATSKIYNSIYEDLMDNYEVKYRRQDDFTVALLIDKHSPASDYDHVFVGVSKRNPIDHASPLRGRALALSRAVRRVVESRLRGEKEEAQPATNGTSGKHFLTTSSGHKVYLDDALPQGHTPYTPRT